MATLTDVQKLRVVPAWLQKTMTQKDLDTIRDAVTQAEASTTAEIVPMIVRRSIVIGPVPLLLFLFFSALGLMIAPSFKAYFQSQWPALSLVIVDCVGVFVAALLAYTLSSLGAVQRFLTSVADTFHQVHARAHLEFETSNIRKTSLHTGILIFVSLAERKVVILADEAISSKLPDEVWLQMIEPLLLRIKKGELAQGLCEAILRCGEMTRDLFPARDGHRNELGNDLIIKD